MNNSKKTRNALISSIIALMLCLSMFMGTTMAWFTDTATTSVNTIQAGTLDIDIVKAEDTTVSLAGDTLNFKKAAGNAVETILWEPGVTYELDNFKVINKGNLAAKYTITVSGITGDAKLLEAIEFTVTEGNTVIDLATFEGHLDAKDGANDESDTIVIKGHMKEEAGNEYQGLSLTGISVRISATQYTVEHDSYNNTYDANAEYEAYAYDSKTVEKDNESKLVTKTTLSNNGATATVPAETKLESGTSELVLIVEETDETQATGIVIGDNTGAYAYEIEVVGIDKTSNTTDIEVVLEGDMALPTGLTGVKAYRDGVELPSNLYSYDPNTGIVTLKVKHFCNFTFTYVKNTDNPYADVTITGAQKDLNSIVIDMDNFEQSVKEALEKDPTLMDLETSYKFEAKPDQETMEKYSKWYADFRVTTSEDIQSGEAYLAGQYNGWADEYLPEEYSEFDNNWIKIVGSFEGNTPTRLLNGMVTYGELIDYNTPFNCGASSSIAMDFKVELILVNPENESDVIVVGSYEYSFPGTNN